MTIWINGGIKGTAQLAAAKPVCLHCLLSWFHGGTRLVLQVASSSWAGNGQMLLVVMMIIIVIRWQWYQQNTDNSNNNNNINKENNGNNLDDFSGGRQTLSCIVVLRAVCVVTWRCADHPTSCTIYISTLYCSWHMVVTMRSWFWRNAHQKICTDGTPVMIRQSVLRLTVLSHSIRQHSKPCLTQALQQQRQWWVHVTWTTHIAYALCMLASLSASINFPDEPLEQIVSLVACCFDWSISWLPSQSNVANKQAHNQSSLPVFGAHQLNVWMHERSINLLVID